MARASELIINTKDAERKMTQLNESAIIAGKAIDHLISAVTEATKAIQEYQNIADKFCDKWRQDKMGEVADDVLAGLMCETCGVWMPDVFEEDSDLFENPPGHPRQCPDCIKEEKQDET